MQCDLGPFSQEGWHYNTSAELWLCPACAAALPSLIEGLCWDRRFSAEPHSGCVEEQDCPGPTCQYNALCGRCSCLLAPSTHIFCLERRSRELTVCASCFQDMEGELQEEGGWAVDGELFTEGHEQWR
jgi:hypothetical protein